MGSIITSGACCCCNICCNQVFDALGQLLGKERMTKLSYLFLVIVFVIPSIFIFFFLYNWTSFKDYFVKWFHCPNNQDFQCIGASAIYRLSMSLLGLFLLMLVLMLLRNKCSQVINEGVFCIKYLLVIGTFIGLLFVDNTVFDNYATASKYISIIYMLLQSIILIDLFYTFSIELVKNYDQGNTRYGVYLILFTILFQSIAIFLNVYGYVLFSSTDNGQCTTLIWVNIITSVILLIIPMFQICQFNPQNSLLITSLISLYISYLSFIAQFSYPGKCSKITIASLAVDIAISTFIFALSMYGSIIGGSGQIKITKDKDINKTIGIAPHTSIENTYEEHYDRQMKKNPQTHLQLNNNEGVKKSSNNNQNLSQSQKYSNSWDWVKWHLYMSIASIYIAVLITNWNSANVITQQLSTSGFSFWVRIVIAWVTVLIYLWTIIAPKVIPSRNFEVV